jgi:hypothetical protein
MIASASRIRAAASSDRPSIRRAWASPISASATNSGSPMARADGNAPASSSAPSAA